jgi:energy-converting hydrogenase Eha subunit C
MSDFAPETGPDGRPRPRYGEYATPEEQRARIAQPDATFALDAGVAPGDASDSRSDAPSPARPTMSPPTGVDRRSSLPATTPRAGGGPLPPMADPGAKARQHPVDRIATIALLAYGALNVVLSMPAYFDLAGYMPQVMSVAGIDATFTNTEGAKLWGPIAAIVLIVGYVVTAFLAVRALRRGRIAWWIPLVGAAVSYFAASLCILVVLLGDPAFSALLASP